MTRTTSAPPAPLTSDDSESSTPEATSSGSTPAPNARRSGRSAAPGTGSPPVGSESLPTPETTPSDPPPPRYNTRAMTVQELDQRARNMAGAQTILARVWELDQQRPEIQKNLRRAESEMRDLEKSLKRNGEERERVLKGLAILLTGDDRIEHINGIEKLATDKNRRA